LRLQDDNATISFGVLGDVNLYRASQTELKTDNDLIVAGKVLAGPDKLDILAELMFYRSELRPTHCPHKVSNHARLLQACTSRDRQR
jgi:hypothetical protein